VPTATQTPEKTPTDMPEPTTTEPSVTSSEESALLGQLLDDRVRRVIMHFSRTRLGYTG